MIKDIKKIDLQGNEYYQESIICNRCKKVLAPEDYYHKIELTQWRPVKIEPGHAYGLSHHEPWHICDKCYPKIVAELNGDTYTKKFNCSLEDKTTEELLKFRSSFMCSVDTAYEIEKILEMRGYPIQKRW